MLGVDAAGVDVDADVVELSVLDDGEVADVDGVVVDDEPRLSFL